MSAQTLPKFLENYENTFVEKRLRSKFDSLKEETSITIYDSFFEKLLEKLATGMPLTAVLRDDCRNIDKSHFLSWVMKDHIRKNRYYEALEIGSEITISEMLEIADGKDSEGQPSPEDIARSSLRINTRKYVIGVQNRKRFGEVKQLEVSTSISITAALEQANSRLIDIPSSDYADCITVDSTDSTDSTDSIEPFG